MLRYIIKLIPATLKFQYIRNYGAESKKITKAFLRYSSISFKNKNKSYYESPPAFFGIWGINILTWLGFTSGDEEKESELIKILKRAVLCMKKEQYNAAEQLLHLALKIAQEQQNEQGIIYCFDLMANLALEQLIFDKAEKLFVAVLQILLSKGVQQNDLKVIHISLKLARIAQLKAEMEKAELGYQWCLEKIKEQKIDNLDAQVLSGVIQDWYAQFLLDKGDTEKALTFLKGAYEVCEETMGSHNEKSMLLLNDLGITSFRAGDMVNAENYLNKGIKIGHKVDDQTHVGVLHANLGLVLLHQGIIKQAEKYCVEALKLGTKNKNDETIGQANYCFEQIKLILENK
ncbi:tetratricopeptide repeat protein 19 homolog, mitochondrial [Harmonia axyridis]|uniref:tetratricopeptide repeat protein 19 homolog, mitochondrial n=1 Tax=Harmonia axyridis TaxID=115357 RepID=UPI001E276A5C|nr:tetratricopeptide repeat protein 19 homolog, mitochondrial [Harmonia axyridis]